jgi:hypothetical protein
LSAFPAEPDTASTGPLPRPFFICETAVKTRRRLTRARLRELLHYDPETGEFRWLKRMSQAVRAGDIAGTLNKTHHYWSITIKGSHHRAHHLAWLYMTGKWCRLLIDHRDGNPSNNRWDNLRKATVWQNNANRCRQRNNVCGFKGVTRNRWGTWSAVINKKGRRRHLGTFPTPQAAHQAYVAAARKLFGEFARTE